jgi:hypothetical protein
VAAAARDGAEVLDLMIQQPLAAAAAEGHRFAGNLRIAAVILSSRGKAVVSSPSYTHSCQSASYKL